MINTDQLHSLDPRTWPWFVDLWVAIVLTGLCKPAWPWLQRKRAEKWKVEHGRIERVITKPQFLSHARRDSFVSEIEYTYSLWGTSYVGRYKRALPTEYEAEAFVRDPEGMPLAVRCDPANPARSFVLEPDVEALLQQLTSGARGPIARWQHETKGFL